MKKLHAISVAHHKNTAYSPARRMEVPKQVLIPMSMHMGAPCEPLVKLKQQVSVGECIGASDAFFSADIHASVSGTVTAITDYRMPNGNYCKAVEITSDGLQTPYSELKPPVYTNREEYIAAVRRSGVLTVPTPPSLPPADVAMSDGQESVCVAKL